MKQTIVLCNGLARMAKSHDYTPPPANCVCGRVYCFHVVRPSVRPSLTFCFLKGDSNPNVAFNLTLFDSDLGHRPMTQNIYNTIYKQTCTCKIYKLLKYTIYKEIYKFCYMYLVKDKLPPFKSIINIASQRCNVFLTLRSH